jgi:adenylate cyclase class IV
MIVNLDKREISLKELYRGAIGKDSVLNTQIKLKKLDIYIAKSQFPKTFPLKKLDNKTVKNMDGLVVINGKSSQFADVFTMRQTSNGEEDIIIGLQEKWYTTSKNLAISDIKKEHDKNKNAFNLANNEDLKNKLENTRIVTVMFTSQSFKGNVNDMPDDVLVIARKNFEQYFGPLFSSRSIFDIFGELNLNHADPMRIEAILKDIGPETSMKICEQRPFYGVEDLLSKEWDKSCAARLKKCRIQLEQCSYAPYSFLTNDSDSNIYDTDTEMAAVDDDVV